MNRREQLQEFMSDEEIDDATQDQFADLERERAATELVAERQRERAKNAEFQLAASERARAGLREALKKFKTWLDHFEACALCQETVAWCPEWYRLQDEATAAVEPALRADGTP